MNVAVIGGTGRVGSRIAKELQGRGHQVTVIARNTPKQGGEQGVRYVAGDIKSDGWIHLKGHDAVVSSVHFTDLDAPTLLRAVKASGTPRLIVAGGAGSLEVAPGVRLVDTPDFPAQYKAEAEAGRNFLELIRQENDLDWTYMSPSAVLEPGERTGRYRVGNDSLLITSDGRSYISMEDFAVALVSELEHPEHTRTRFTAGY